MEDFVTFTQAVNLKKLGFNCECETYWEDEWSYEDHNWVIKYTRDNVGISNDRDIMVLRPTLAQAQKWLREKGVKVYIKPLFSSEKYVYCISFKFRGYGGDEDYGVKDTWEEALAAGINEAIKLLKNEEKRNKRWYEE